MAYIIVFRKLQNAISATNFPTIYFKLKQIQVFKSILNHFDVIVVLPTSYRKSCLFQLLPGLLQQSNEQGIVIILSPLNSIIIDQSWKLWKSWISKLVFWKILPTVNLQPQAFVLVCVLRQTSRMYQMMLKTVAWKYSSATQKHYLMILVELY